VNRTRLGVLVSGSGTNLQALLDACAAKDFPAEVSVVLSNVGEAFALERAQRANVPSVVLDPRDYPTRAQYDLSLVAALQANGVELVCLAGFMRLLGPDFLRAFPGRVLNIHPALLPAFPGLHGPRQAIAHGVKIAGCTVHLVDEGLDSGPILAQAAVPVLPDDDEQRLAARILEQEHRLYPLAVRALAEGRIEVEGRRVRVHGEPLAESFALRNPGAVG
jgi:phosphoribosylglycinamide formyltransferase 1